MTISFGLHYSIVKKVNLCQGNGQHFHILYTSMKIKKMMTTNNTYILRIDVLWMMKVLGAKLFNSLTAKIASWKVLEQKITHFMRLRDLSVQLSFFVFHKTICIFVCIVKSTLIIKKKKRSFHPNHS